MGQCRERLKLELQRVRGWNKADLKSRGYLSQATWMSPEAERLTEPRGSRVCKVHCSLGAF